MARESGCAGEIDARADIHCTQLEALPAVFRLRKAAVAEKSVSFDMGVLLVLTPDSKTRNLLTYGRLV